MYNSDCAILPTERIEFVDLHDVPPIQGVVSNKF